MHMMARWISTLLSCIYSPPTTPEIFLLHRLLIAINFFMTDSFFPPCPACASRGGGGRGGADGGAADAVGLIVDVEGGGGLTAAFVGRGVGAGLFTTFGGSIGGGAEVAADLGGLDALGPDDAAWVGFGISLLVGLFTVPAGGFRLLGMRSGSWIVDR
jgi:hypothetical protein